MVFEYSASTPTAMLAAPVVVLANEAYPKAVLELAVVEASSEIRPIAVL